VIEIHPLSCGVGISNFAIILIMIRRCRNFNLTFQTMKRTFRANIFNLANTRVCFQFSRFDSMSRFCPPRKNQ
jgi:hypothetical protein